MTPSMKAVMARFESLPHIEYIGADGKWTELYGHACDTEEEAQRYVDRFNAAGAKFRLKPKEESK